jgi:Tfp pilus assembly protein PilO
MTRTNKILLAAVVAAAAISAFYFLALAPKREEIAKLDADIAAKVAEVEQARVTLATYEKAKASYKKNYATLARLGKALPADDDVRSLLVQLEGAADRSGVDFSKIELGTAGTGAQPAQADVAPAPGELASAPGTVPVAGGVLSAMPFNFTFGGSYFDLSAFFSRLEHFVTVNNERLDATGRLLRLESVQITPAPTGFPDMQAQIAAATYVVPPVQGVPGAATQVPAQGTGTAATTPSTTPPTTSASAGGAG